MQKNISAHLALATVAFIYGANYVIAKDVLNNNFMTPNGFIMLRILSGVLLFFLFHTLFIKEKVERKDIAYLALCGLFGVAINQLCFFQGLKHTSPSHASLIMVLVPVLVLIASKIILKTKVTLPMVIGMGLGLAGATLLLLNNMKPSEQQATIIGDLFIMTNATSYAVYLVLVRRMTKKYHPITVVKWVFFFGMFYTIPFGAGELLATDWSIFPSNIWWAVAYVLLGTTFLAYLLNAFALSKVMPSTVSFYIYFQPLIATSIAVLLGRDAISLQEVAAAILLFAGVYLASNAAAKQRKLAQQVT